VERTRSDLMKLEVVQNQGQEGENHMCLGSKKFPIHFGRMGLYMGARGLCVGCDCWCQAHKVDDGWRGGEKGQAGSSRQGWSSWRRAGEEQQGGWGGAGVQ